MGFFLKIGKKQTLFLFIKKYNKQSIKNYRPVSILPICGKIFERLVYRNIFSFLIENSLISQNPALKLPMISISPLMMDGE